MHIRSNTGTAGGNRRGPRDFADKFLPLYYPPAAISGTGATNPSLIERQAAYRELIAARDDNSAFSIVDRDRLIDAVNRLPTMNTFVALQVHGAMTGVVWLGRLEEEYRTV